MHKHSTNTLLSFYALVSSCSLLMYQVSFLDVLLLFIFFRSINLFYLQSAVCSVTSCYVMHFEIKTISFFFFTLFSYMSNSMDLFMCSCPLDMVKTRTFQLKIFFGAFFLRCVYISAVGHGICSFPKKGKKISSLKRAWSVVSALKLVFGIRIRLNKR